MDSADEWIKGVIIMQTQISNKIGGAPAIMLRDPISGEAPTDPNQNCRWLVVQTKKQKLGGIDIYYPNADGRFQVGKEILSFIAREDLTIYQNKRTNQSK